MIRLTYMKNNTFVGHEHISNVLWFIKNPSDAYGRIDDNAREDIDGTQGLQRSKKRGYRQTSRM